MKARRLLSNLLTLGILTTIILVSSACKKKNNNEHPYIGEHFGGGIIFYIDGSGQHGLIVATSDQNTAAPWGCQGESMGTDSVIGTGQANTKAIVKGCGTAGIAARICDDLVLNGYDDWFLPSLNELLEVYKRKNVIGDLGDIYWSSTEFPKIYNNDLAWSVFFGPIYADPETNQKINGYNVRAVRAF